MSKTITPAESNESSKSKPYPVVAIGASAGGLEAMTQLLKHLRPDTGMAYVYIQHLDPTHESMLSEILGRATRMKVMQAAHMVPIQPNTLFIIPPDKNLAIIDGVITLNERKVRPVVNMPVDEFFISLAERQKDGAIGIVLSGTANDGTAGLRAIKVAGGITMAQDDSAKFKGMPSSAITEGAVDLVLPPAGMAMELERLSGLREKIVTIMHDDGEDDSSRIDADENAEINEIIRMLKKTVRVDFSHYKRNTIRRRILRRMLLNKFENLKDYSAFLKQNSAEQHVLYQDMLINVTSFFRDEDTVEYLKKTLLPRIIKNKQPGDAIRIWVPACASGEEAYSLAIIMMELLGEEILSMPVQIFATDLSENAIKRARRGLYLRNELQNVSAQRLETFFTRENGTYRVNKPIRDLCVFAPHNLLKDPPFSRLDLISCCNLLIYLDATLQKKVVSTFYYSLNALGYVVIGKSETIGVAGQLFVQLEKKYRIYAKKADATARVTAEIGYSPSLPAELRSGNGTQLAETKTLNAPDLEKLVDDILLTKYVPACVVVNQDMEILLFRGSTGLFLEPSPGKASLNLVKMTRPSLAFEMRAAIHKANKQGSPVKKTGLDVKVKSEVHKVSIEVIPLKPNEEERLFMVIFEEMTSAEGAQPAFSKDKVVKKLQDELNTLRDDMRSLVEEQEAGKEELQSANEEIISSNEELQSMNEELETAKEEVESANEELMTINTELQVRNDQLSESYEYAEAVLETIRECILVLSPDFRVKMANRAFYSIFQVSEEDTEGRLLFELGNRQWNVLRLRQLLDDVVQRDKKFESLEITHDFPGIGQKTMLLNARKVVQRNPAQAIILVAIDDITDYKIARGMLSGRDSLFRDMAENAPVMIWVTDTDKRFTYFNSTWLDFTGRSEHHETGQGWISGIHEEDRQRFLGVFNSQFEARKNFSVRFRLRRHDGKYCNMLCKGKPEFLDNNKFLGYTGSCIDIPSPEV
jgi:two-component system, chemotaxis family, CheB/CheR fusion protein